MLLVCLEPHASHSPNTPQHTPVWNSSLKNISLSTKLILKIFCGCCFPTFNNKITFNCHFCILYEGCTASDEHRVGPEVRTARTTNGKVIREFISWLPYLFVHLGCKIWRASTCLPFESTVMNAINMLLPYMCS